MTRQFTFRFYILFFLLVLASRQASPAEAAISISLDQVHAQAVLVPVTPGGADIPGVNLPFPDLKANKYKHAMSKIEELGKIHRFHKERVKNAKKHSGLFWITAKIILVCCHLALLVHAFLHLSH